MKMCKTTYWAWLFSLAASLGLEACSRDGEEAGVSVPLEIYSRANDNESPTDESTGEARLFFWTEEKFNSWLGGTIELPKFECRPESIDHYNYSGGIAYNTGHEYPSDGSYLYATGYAPMKALDLTVSENEKKLRVKEGFRNGQTDFLVCDGCDAHSGSSTDRFTQEEHELKFRHLTARIRFVGIRDEVMHNKIGVSNVKIKLHEENGLVVPLQFDWRADEAETQCTYVANLAEKATELAPVEGGSEMIPTTSAGRTLGSCYVLQKASMTGYNPFVEVTESGNISLTMDIEADLWYLTGEASEPIPYTHKRWKNVSVDIETNTGNVMRPGYQYEVRIIFRNESIVLQGLQKGWEDGGTHYIPVRPGLENNQAGQP